MPCFREGGCGPYENLSCSECPASRPEYIKTYNIPTIEEYAYWIDDKNGSTYAYGEKVAVKICSNCKHACPFNLLGDPIYSKYCPHCGKKMKKGEKNAHSSRA